MGLVKIILANRNVKIYKKMVCFLNGVIVMINIKMLLVDIKYN